MPCDHGTHLSRVSGSLELTTDVIQIAPARERAVHPMAAASGRPEPTGPPGGYCRTLPATEWVLGGYIHRCFCLLRGKKCHISHPNMGQKKRGRPKKTIQPTIIEAGILPVITKPMGIIGKHVELPGSYWPRRGQSAEELRTLYRCVVRDYTSAHTFQNGKTSAAWQVQEMGVSGTATPPGTSCGYRR